MKQSPMRALRHPLFLTALLLLVLNDHVLKGSGLAPAWLTGKLSDFAGLIVAPMVLSAMISARTAHRRALAFGVVGAWFAAINVFPPAAAATEALLGAIGVPSRLWVDPSDLVALAAMPFAWHAMAQGGTTKRTRWVEKLALAAAVPACIATSPTLPQMSDAMIYNDTDGDIELTVRWASARVDCDAVSENLAEIVPASAFGPPGTFTVLENRAIGLDRDRSFSRVGTDVNDGTCDVAMVSANGLPETIVLWDGGSRSNLPLEEVEADDPRVTGALHLAPGSDDAVVIVGNEGFQIAAPLSDEDYVGDQYCEDFGERVPMRWSGLEGLMGEPMHIHTIQPSEEPGCLAIALGDGFDVQREAEICIPEGDFPFAENAEIQIWDTRTEEGDSLRIVRDLPMPDGTLWRTGELTMVTGRSTYRLGQWRLEVGNSNPRCLGERLECGAFRVPAAAIDVTAEGEQYLHAGARLEADDADGRRMHLLVGDAEIRHATSESCEPTAAIGATFDALIWYEAAPRQ